jgi:hypothetical protein
MKLSRRHWLALGFSVLITGFPKIGMGTPPIQIEDMCLMYPTYSNSYQDWVVQINNDKIMLDKIKILLNKPI